MAEVLETQLLCLRSIKKLFKVKSMDLYSSAMSATICVFTMTVHCLFLYNFLNVKKHFYSSVSDLIDNKCIQKIRNQLKNF